MFVGKDRVESGRLALEQFQPGVFLLDDGLQFWQLKRNLDIVLVDSKVPFDNGYPIPRGALREPKRNLRRAGIVVITRSDAVAEEMIQELEREISRLAPDAAVFRAEHRVTRLRPLNSSARAQQAPLSPVAACGIAQPDAFLSSLLAYGAPVSAQALVALNDHARYDEADLIKIHARIAALNADSLIVTEKDAVKIDSAEFDVPVYAAELAVKVRDIQRFWNTVQALSGLSHQSGEASLMV